VLLYASSHTVWFDLETDILFGLTGKSRHGLIACGEERTGGRRDGRWGTCRGLTARADSKAAICAPDGAGNFAVAWFVREHDKHSDSSRPAGLIDCGVTRVEFVLFASLGRAAM
jgi:hypothetical protein